MSATSEPVLDRAAVREIDRAALDEYGLPSIVLMENAARALAAAALEMLDERGAAPPARVAIVCGPGNNGGDGWALARHLHNAGHAPVIISHGAMRAGSDGAINRDVGRRMGIEELAAPERTRAWGIDLVVDALFGTGLTRSVDGEAAELIAWINAGRAPVLAVDLPSGLDCDTGRPLGACVRATRTVTFVASKPGFSAPEASPYVGRVTVGDIGVPRELVLRAVRRGRGGNAS